jgi:hypothetical protein
MRQSSTQWAKDGVKPLVGKVPGVNTLVISRPSEHTRICCSNITGGLPCRGGLASYDIRESPKEARAATNEDAFCLGV